MKERPGNTDEATIAQAELAIKDSEQRAALLNEMWDSLGISPQITHLLFAEGSATQKSQAEQELLGELHRRRQHSSQEKNSGARPRRPAMMRGLVI